MWRPRIKIKNFLEVCQKVSSTCLNVRVVVACSQGERDGEAVVDSIILPRQKDLYQRKGDGGGGKTGYSGRTDGGTGRNETNRKTGPVEVDNRKVVGTLILGRVPGGVSYGCDDRGSHGSRPQSYRK